MLASVAGRCGVGAVRLGHLAFAGIGEVEPVPLGSRERLLASTDDSAIERTERKLVNAGDRTHSRLPFDGQFGRYGIVAAAIRSNRAGKLNG